MNQVLEPKEQIFRKLFDKTNPDAPNDNDRIELGSALSFKASFSVGLSFLTRRYRAKSFSVNWPSFVRNVIASAASHDAITTPVRIKL